MEASIVCRACLTTISLEYIDLETPLYDDTTFLDCYNYCTNLQASLDDDLPKNICVSCGRSLQIAYDFIKASCNADQMLRKSLHLFENKIQFSENDIIVKKEEDDNLIYHTEYIEDVETAPDIKEEVDVLPKFEVVLSNEKANENDSDNWMSTDEDSSWPVFTLEDEADESGTQAGDLMRCNICGENIVKKEYDNHVNSHSEKPSYKCDECEENFLCENSLGLHKKSKHKTRQFRENFICGWCGEAFHCRSKLIKHRVIDHNGKVPSFCLTCGEKVSDEASLRRHVKKAHGVAKTPVLCPYCNKEFKGIALHIKSNHPDVLRIHIPEDGSVKLSRNQCPYCFRQFPSQNILNDHLNTHTGERPYSCSSCEKAFHKKSIRDRHELMVHQSKDLPKEKCDVCDFSTSNIFSLRSHKFRHRRPIEKKYLCAFCPMRFINPKKLLMHEDFKHGNGEKAFQCEICEKKFTSMRKLKEHQLCVHVVGRPHECSMCNKRFKNDFQLKAHEKLHTGKQIDCPQCDKKFARQVDLKIHMRTHTGELPYECHLCDKRYAIKVRLTYHLQKHMGVKHKCQQCPSEFNSRSKLRLHMFKHIGMPYVCDHCQMGYPNRVGLRRHSKSAHKIILTAEDLLENRRKNELKMYSNYVNTTHQDSTEPPNTTNNVENEL